MMDRIKKLIHSKLKPKVRKKTLLIGEQDQLDIISYDAMEEQNNYLVIDNSYFRTHSISLYPRDAYSGWLDDLYDMPMSYDTSQFIEEVDALQSVKDLSRKLTEFKSTENAMIQRNAIVDSELTDAIDSVTNMKSSILRGEEKMFQSSIYVGVKEDSLDNLNKTTKKLETELSKRLFRISPEKYRQLEGVQTILPRGEDQLGQKRNMTSSSLALTFPFASSQLVQENGILYGVSSSHSLIFIDRFSLHNANSITFAKSGSGKSYASKVEILRQVMMGTKVIVIDPEREYVDLCKSLGGSYIKLSATSKDKINPFDVATTAHSNEQFAEHAQNLIEILSLMMGGLDNTDILDEIIFDLYKDLPKGKTPLLRDLYVELNKRGHLELAKKLAKYLDGTLSGVFSEKTNVELDNDLIVFDIKDMHDSLRQITMMIVANFVENTVKNSKLEKRQLVIDEAWLLLQHEESSRFITALVRRARKYYLAVSIISQDAEDFLGDKNGRIIAAQSSMRIIMRQSESSIEMVSREFKLSEREKDFLLKAERGEALMIADESHVLVTIVASTKEHPLITTSPQEKLLVDVSD